MRDAFEFLAEKSGEIFLEIRGFIMAATPESHHRHSTLQGDN